EKPIIKELHLGGGTPTFFSPLQLQRLVNGILAKAEVADEYEFSFEAHPNSTTKAHLQALFEVGFMRISVGVQDFDAQIMRIINRSQSEAEVRQVTQWARDIGYTSINFDLIFGLPLQTPAHIERNMALLQELRPDRLAFYSYAHVPWIKPSQRAYSEADLPKGKAKRHLYELGRTLLEAMGYCEIGLDHFALRSDGLYKALQSGALHRNFMGYTPHYTRLSIGLGVSAISDSWDGYVQNEKKIKVYKKRVAAGEIPFFRGHLLSAEDEQIRQHILNLMCRYETTWAMTKGTDESWYASLHRLEELMRDELVEYAPFQLKVTERGRPFVRNICLAFDARYWRRQPEGQLFSAVV
ncbi:MAG: radical SAM protein, partial [Bacteroidota bacterium]